MHSGRKGFIFSLKYVPAYLVTLYIKHWTLLGLLSERSPNLSLDSFSLKSIFSCFVQKDWSNNVKCHMYKVTKYAGTYFSENMNFKMLYNSETQTRFSYLIVLVNKKRPLCSRLCFSHIQVFNRPYYLLHCSSKTQSKRLMTPTCLFLKYFLLQKSIFPWVTEISPCPQGVKSRTMSRVTSYRRCLGKTFEFDSAISYFRI